MRKNCDTVRVGGWAWLSPGKDMIVAFDQFHLRLLFASLIELFSIAARTSLPLTVICIDFQLGYYRFVIKYLALPKFTYSRTVDRQRLWQCLNSTPTRCLADIKSRIKSYVWPLYEISGVCWEIMSANFVQLPLDDE